MSAPKKSSGYPLEFQNIAESFEKRPEVPMELKFKSMKLANAFRAQFHAFRTVMTAEDDTYLRELTALQLKVRDNPPRVIIEHKDHTELAIAIKQAVAERESSLTKED